MRAMVLSAGRGLRLRPLTFELPKPAIPVLGRPILLHILARLARAGLRSTAVNVHHLAEMVERLVESDPGLPKTHISREPVLLGTAGGLRQAAPFLRGDGPILVHNGDCLSDIDLGDLMVNHRRSGKLATLVLIPPRPGYGTVEVDADGDVLSLAGAPLVPEGLVASRLLFTGCHLIEEAVLDQIPPEGPSSIVADVYRPLAARGELGGYLHGGYWWEFGEPLAYLEGSLGLIDLAPEARARILDADPVRMFSSGRAAVGPRVEIATSARIEGRCVLGSACRVGAGAVLTDSVVLDEASVGAGSRLRRVIVGAGTRIPPGFECGDAVLARDPGLGEPPAGIERAGENWIRSFQANGGSR